MKKLILTMVILIAGFMVYKSTMAGSTSKNLEILKGPMDLVAGTYMIRSTIGPKHYLDLDASTNGDKCKLNGLGDSKEDNKWSIRKVNGVLGGYTIQNSRFGTYLDADYNNTQNSGCRVQGWERGKLDTRNQEWYIEEFLVSGKKMYQVTNVKNSNMALDANDGVSNREVKLQPSTSSTNSENEQLFFMEKQ